MEEITKTILNLLNQNVLLVIAFVFVSGITYLLNKVLEDGILSHVKNWFKKLFSLHTVKYSKIIYGQINDMLYEATIKYSADRAFICQFHNGQVFAAGNQMWKSSMTYERCSPGTSFEAKNNQEIKVETIWSFLQNLFTEKIDEKGIYISSKTSTCQRCAFPKRTIVFATEQLEYSHTKYWLETRGTKYIMVNPLLDTKQNIVGYFALEFCDDSFIINDIGCDICHIATNISILLNQK